MMNNGRPHLKIQKEAKKPNKIILKTLDDANSKFNSTSQTNDNLEDLKDIASRCTSIQALYPCFETYSEKTITLYISDYKKEVQNNYKKACELFALLAKFSTGYFALNQKIKIEMLKIYVLTIQENASQFMQIFSSTPKEEIRIKDSQSPLNDSFALNNFLYTFTQESDVYEYYKPIFRVLCDTIRLIQQKMHHIPFINSSTIANFLYSQYFSLNLLVAYYEEASASNEDANDGIKAAYEFLLEMLIQSLKSLAFQLPIFGQEQWVKGKKEHLKNSNFWGRRRLSVIFINEGSQESPAFTLRHAILFSFLSFYRLMTIRKIPKKEDRALEAVAEIIKKNTMTTNDRVDHKKSLNTEAMLNENIYLLKILKQFLKNAKDPILILEQAHMKQYLNLLLFMQLYVALTNKLVLLITPKEINQIGNENSVLNYRTTQDYISYVIKFLDNIRFVKGEADPPLMNFANQTLLEILGNVGKDLNKIKRSYICIMKCYLVEYTSYIPEIELGLNLITGKIFNFVAPQTLTLSDYNSDEDLLEEEAAIIIVKWINSMSFMNQKWASIIFKCLIKEAKVGTSEKEQLFGIFRLIYCATMNKIVDYKSFHSLVVNNPEIESTIELQKQYENNVIIENNLLEIFFEVQAVDELFEKLITCYTSGVIEKETQKMSVSMTENFVVYLHNFPAICERLLGSPKKVIYWIESIVKKPEIPKFVLILISKLLCAVKCRKTLPAQGTEDNTYLPLMIFNFLNDRLQKYDYNFQSLIYPLFKLLSQFIPIELLTPSIVCHQDILSTYPRVETFLKILYKNR